MVAQSQTLKFTAIKIRLVDWSELSKTLDNRAEEGDVPVFIECSGFIELPQDIEIDMETCDKDEDNMPIITVKEGIDFSVQNFIVDWVS